VIANRVAGGSDARFTAPPGQRSGTKPQTAARRASILIVPRSRLWRAIYPGPAGAAKPRRRQAKDRDY